MDASAQRSVQGSHRAGQRGADAAGSAGAALMLRLRLGGLTRIVMRFGRRQVVLTLRLMLMLRVMHWALL
jgi:hypothetical protein